MRRGMIGRFSIFAASLSRFPYRRRCRPLDEEPEMTIDATLRKATETAKDGAPRPAGPALVCWEPVVSIILQVLTPGRKDSRADSGRHPPADNMALLANHFVACVDAGWRRAGFTRKPDRFFRIGHLPLRIGQGLAGFHPDQCAGCRCIDRGDPTRHRGVGDGGDDGLGGRVDPPRYRRLPAPRTSFRRSADAAA